MQDASKSLKRVAGCSHDSQVDSSEHLQVQQRADSRQTVLGSEHGYYLLRHSFPDSSWQALFAHEPDLLEADWQDYPPTDSDGEERHLLHKAALT